MATSDIQELDEALRDEVGLDVGQRIAIVRVLRDLNWFPIPKRQR